MDFRKSVANGKKLLADKKGTSIVSVMVAFFHPHAGYPYDDDIHHCFFEADK